MDLTTFASLASSLSNIIFVFVAALGYYFLIRTNQKTLEEMRAQRLAGGRPTVIVTDNYNNLPEIDLVIRNMVGGPAKEIYEHRRYVTHRDLGDLLDVVERAVERLIGDYDQPERTKRKGPSADRDEGPDRS